MAYVGAAGIKVIAVDGVLPSAKTANDGSYTLAHRSGCLLTVYKLVLQKEFLDFALTELGEKIVASTGFVPVSKFMCNFSLRPSPMEAVFV